MIIKDTLNPGETGYVVNVFTRSNNKLECERFDGYTKESEALIVAESLVDNESKIFSSKQVVYTTVEEVECNPNNGNFNYKVLEYFTTNQMMNKNSMLNEDFFNMVQKKFPYIYDFTIEEDHEEDGTPINICWLKLGYLSPSSNCGFFHFTSVESMFKDLSLVEVYQNCNKNVQEEYMFWLASNTCLFNSKNNEEIIEQIARMCFQQNKGEIL